MALLGLGLFGAGVVARRKHGKSSLYGRLPSL